ncbi:MAG: imidazolonepropionase [Polyangiales bacterium]
MQSWIALGRIAGMLDDGAIVVERGAISWIGRENEVPERFAPLLATARRATLITPGLVDAHTHSAWVGSRHGEYAMKLRGEGYEAIAQKGGGIVASMRGIEAASVEEITETLVSRLQRMARLGVTTVEVKTGYGLRPELERRQLQAIVAASRRTDLPRVVPTFLALHALPPESRGDEQKRAAYVASAIELTKQIDGARFVDAYVDRNAFRVEEARAVFLVARERGLGVRIHVGQFADVGGAELAAEVGARSCDHLEHVGPAGLEAMARGSVSATLLPIASFVLNQVPPDVAALRAAKIPLIVASDANPGTAPSESLPLALAFAARLYGLSADEVLLGATRNAARSLDLADVGSIEVGARADLAGWDLPHEEAMLQPWGTPKTAWVVRDGAVIAH